MRRHPGFERPIAAETFGLEGGAEHGEGNRADARDRQVTRIDPLEHVTRILHRERREGARQVQRGREIEALQRGEIGARELVSADDQHRRANTVL